MLRKLVLLSFVLVLAFGATAFAQEDGDMPVIGFVQFVSHPALDAGRDGALEVLEAAGYVDGETATFLFGNGEGEIPALNTIVEDFLDEGVDLIIATSTPALQAAYSVTADLEGPPVIFNVVTSPYAAGVAEAACIHPSWVTGSQALAPYADTVPLIFEIVPDAESIGYIYNTAEANSVANTEIITPIMEDLGLTMEIQTISNSSEVPQAAEALVAQGIDAFYVATDSTVVAGLEGLIQVANENEIPVIASDPSSAARGAVLAQGLDYMQEGRDAGRMAVAYLNGDIDIATTSISRQTINLLAVNLDAAEAQGVTVPEELLATAGIIIEDGAETMVARAEMSAEEQAAADAEFIAELECTPEIIEEQQAALDAAAED